MKPLRDYLVMNEIPKPVVTKAGIYIGGADVDNTLRGKVAVVGVDVKEVAVDDEVLFHSGQGLRIEGGQILIREAELSYVF
jgi:co-chaperonin GroES (HSP10)